MRATLKELLHGKQAHGPSPSMVQHMTPVGVDPALPSLLVVASSHSTATVAQVAAQLGLNALRVKTMGEALAKLVNGHPGQYAGAVAALGTTPETFLFDMGGGRQSSLICAASSKGLPVIVYSHTACRNQGTLSMCMGAGAAAVVDSAKELHLALEAARVSGACAPAMAPAQQAALIQQQQQQQQQLQQQQQQQLQQQLLAAASAPGSSYPPLQRRLQRLEYLRVKYGPDHKRTQRSLAITQHLQEAIRRTPLLAKIGTAPEAGHVRFVVVSDTHSQHRELVMPEGDVLIHCGDLTGNYRPGTEDELEQQLLDFAAWLASLPYKRIFLIPGNHDTLLDTESFPEYQHAHAAFMAALPPHATMLMEEGAEYRGLRLWGSPVVVCRLEAMGQRYISCGFERTEARRRATWAQIQEGLDVLVTHTPAGSEGCADPLLAEALAKLRTPPTVHVYGHDHGRAGCGTVSARDQQPPWTWINAAQGLLLHHEQGGGGNAWVLDLPARGA